METFKFEAEHSFNNVKKQIVLIGGEFYVNKQVERIFRDECGSLTTCVMKIENAYDTMCDDVTQTRTIICTDDIRRNEQYYSVVKEVMKDAIRGLSYEDDKKEINNFLEISIEKIKSETAGKINKGSSMLQVNAIEFSKDYKIVLTHTKGEEVALEGDDYAKWRDKYSNAYEQAFAVSKAFEEEYIVFVYESLNSFKVLPFAKYFIVEIDNELVAITEKEAISRGLNDVTLKLDRKKFESTGVVSWSKD